MNDDLIVGTVTHRAEDLEINIHNIPHYHDSVNNTYIYDLTKVKPMKCLLYALKHKLKDVDYEEFIEIEEE